MTRRKPKPPPPDPHIAAWFAMVALWQAGHPRAWETAYGALHEAERGRTRASREGET